MRKILFILMALLLTYAGVANATNIPTAVDPENFPVVWTETVYNGSGSNIATGTIVQWDFDTANPSGTDYDDILPYVKTVSTAESIWTAGVTLFHQGINNGQVGSIIIKGPAWVNRSTNSLTADQLVGSTNAGVATDWSGTGADEATLGVCIKAGVPTVGRFAIIYVDPVRYSDD